MHSSSWACTSYLGYLQEEGWNGGFIHGGGGRGVGGGGGTDAFLIMGLYFVSWLPSGRIGEWVGGWMGGCGRGGVEWDGGTDAFVPRHGRIHCIFVTFG